MMELAGCSSSHHAPKAEMTRQKSAILKYFGLTEKSDPKNVPAILRKKLQGYGRESGHTLLDKIFSGNDIVVLVICFT